jgi:hypothetical protein
MLLGVVHEGSAHRMRLTCRSCGSVRCNPLVKRHALLSVAQ